MIRSFLTAVLFTCGLASTLTARGGRIIVDSDEWALSDSGFQQEGVSNGVAYVKNAARFLTGGTAGARIWINSDNFGLTGSNLRSALAAYRLTDSGSFSPFTFDDLRLYDAVFLAGDSLTFAEEIALILYVKAGGGVYIAAGTGTIVGGAAGEAAQWNVVLSGFSLHLAPVYYGIDGNFAPDGFNPLFFDVRQLFYESGNSVSVTGANAAIVTQLNGQGLIGTYSDGF